MKNIIKDVRNLFRLQKEIYDTEIKDIKNIFRLKKENEAIKDSVIRDIRNFFEHEEEDFYKPVTVDSFQSINYIELKSNGDKIKPYQLKKISMKLDHT